jgi:transcriptional regulator with XRE-family HTH domain
VEVWQLMIDKFAQLWQPTVALRKRGRILTVNAVHEAGNREDFQKLVGDKLRALRRNAGLSQRELAMRLELSHQQIQKYERGDNALPLERIRSYAAALGVSPSSLAFPEDNWMAAESAPILSPDRLELLRLYDALPDRESRDRLLGFLRSLANPKGP